MKIIPAIDLKDGRCVRLLRGDFSAVTDYSSDPVAVARTFSAMQVEDLHVVDLDGARSGLQRNREIVEAIVAESGLRVQLGGGIRHKSDVERWLSCGIARCVIGSIAIDDPANVMAWIHAFGAASIVLALDVKIDGNNTPMLTTHGWHTETDISIWKSLDRYYEGGVRQILCTDVARDGAMAGPNIKLYSDILARYPELQLQASGGVRHIADLQQLRDQGIPYAITGRALLDGEISAAEVALFQRKE